MREILFRGKRIDNGEWVFGELVHDSDGGMAYIVEKAYWNVEDCVDETAYREVIPSTIGQYTGLTDKNGTKIFEGDVVVGRDRKIKYEIKIGTHKTTGLEWQDRIFINKVDALCGVYAECRDKAHFIPLTETGETVLEVIGNIHESEVE